MTVTLKSPAKKHSARTGKHVAPRASAEEIRSAVGVTKKDSAVVRKVLAELGYLGVKVERKSASSFDTQHSKRS